MVRLVSTMVFVFSVIFAYCVWLLSGAYEKIRSYEAEERTADSIMWMTDSVMDVHNTGSLDDPDSVTCEYMYLRDNYQDIINKRNN